MTEKTNIFRPFWRFQNIAMDDIKTIIDTGIEFLKSKKGDVFPDEKIAAEVSLSRPKRAKKICVPKVFSTMEVDKRVKRVKEGFGLISRAISTREASGIRPTSS